MQKTKHIFITTILFLMSLLLVFSFALSNQKLIVSANYETDISHKASILIDYNSNQILAETNAHEKMPIASVTKLMTTLITLENINNGNLKLDQKIIVSENANGMGGSQIFLDANSEYSVEQLLKSVIVASANDSSVALAEHIAGSEQNFVKLMNEKSRELGLKNTHYSNCTGLPTNDGYSSAYDQAIILKQVLSHDLYHEYSSIWLEDFTHPSGRITQMTNTNKLSRFYEGCIGGKTGSTNQAKYCLAVGAKRNDTKLIAVVLGAENSKDRFALASELLNYGFSNFENMTLFSNENLSDKTIKIRGTKNLISLRTEREFSILKNKNKELNFTINFYLPEQMKSVKENEIVGHVEIVVDGVVVDSISILSCNTYTEPSVWDNFKEIINL